jgi:hypothetical protein
MPHQEEEEAIVRGIPISHSKPQKAIALPSQRICCDHLPSITTKLLLFPRLVSNPTASHPKPWLAHKALLLDNHGSILIKLLLRLEIPQSLEHI